MNNKLAHQLVMYLSSWLIDQLLDHIHMYILDRFSACLINCSMNYSIDELINSSLVHYFNESINFLNNELTDALFTKDQLIDYLTS